MTENEALDKILADMKTNDYRKSIENLITVVGRLLDETPIQTDRPDYCSTIDNESIERLKEAWDQLPLTLKLRVAAGHIDAISDVG